MSRIRVAQILEATTGGTRTHLRLLLTHLDRSRFEPTLICADRRNEEFSGDLQQFRRLGIEVRLVDMVRSIHPVRDLAGLRHVRGLIATGGFDVVHTHSSKAGFIGRLAAHQAGVPVTLHTPHGFAFQDGSRLTGTLFAALERMAARWCQAMICVSEAEQEIAVSRGLVDQQRAFVVTNGVDLGEVDQALGGDDGSLRRELGLAQQPVVGTVAEFRPQKGLRHLVATAREVLERRNDVVFLIIGHGELSTQLEQWIGEAGIGDRCRVLRPRGSIWRYHALLDVFVLTSLWEGLPFVVLEAMAAKRPVVATDVSGTKEVVANGETGLLVPVGDVSAAAKGVCALLAEPARARSMGSAGRKLVELSYQVQAKVKQVEQIYATLCAEHNSRRASRDRRWHPRVDQRPRSSAGTDQAYG